MLVVGGGAHARLVGRGGSVAGRREMGQKQRLALPREPVPPRPLRLPAPLAAWRHQPRPPARLHRGVPGVAKHRAPLPRIVEGRNAKPRRPRRRRDAPALIERLPHPRLPRRPEPTYRVGALPGRHLVPPHLTPPTTTPPPQPPP